MTLLLAPALLLPLLPLAAAAGCPPGPPGDAPIAFEATILATSWPRACLADPRGASPCGERPARIRTRVGMVRWLRDPGLPGPEVLDLLHGEGDLPILFDVGDRYRVVSGGVPPRRLPAELPLDPQCPPLRTTGAS